MLIIAGLGNPGDKYKNTRHNIGFRVTGYLADKFGISGKSSAKFNSIIGKGSINSTEVLIVQPQTYMNLSGQAIQSVLNWHKVSIENLIVVYDDINIDFGKIRFRPSGSAGGHNGIKSIISCCGSENFPRLKVGIGPNPGGAAQKNFVLQKFSKEEQQHLQEITEVCAEGLEYFAAQGVEAARNKFNGVEIL